MFLLIKRIAENEIFQTGIFLLILINAIFLGMETSSAIMSYYDYIIVNTLVWSQVVFVIEMIIRVLAFGPKNFSAFFKDFWNRFDFIIVSLSFVPGVGGFVTIGRVLKVLRILRIFSISDNLRNYFDGLKTAYLSIFFGSIIYVVLVYVVGLCGYYLFGAIHPTEWGSLYLSIQSVVFLSLLQDVRDIIGPVINSYPLSIFFLIGFYITELTLFIKLIRK